MSDDQKIPLLVRGRKGKRDTGEIDVTTPAGELLLSVIYPLGNNPYMVALCLYEVFRSYQRHYGIDVLDQITSDVTVNLNDDSGWVKV